MGGTSCLLPLLHVGIFLAWVCVGLVHAATIAVISYVHLPWCAQKTLVSLRNLSPLPLTIILASLSINLPWALRVRFTIEISLRAEPYKVPYSVYIDQLWVSVLTTTCCKKKLLWWGLNERGFKKSRTLWWRSKWQIILTVKIILTGPNWHSDMIKDRGAELPCQWTVLPHHAPSTPTMGGHFLASS